MKNYSSILPELVLLAALTVFCVLYALTNRVNAYGSYGTPERPYLLVTEVYEVQPDDTLSSITIEFMKKNTYHVRYFNEFREGIIEENYIVLEDGLQAGDILKISYWINREELYKN